MRVFEDLRDDVRLAARSLMRDKGFTLTVLLTFGLCLGANVALFAVVNASLLRPLPYPDSDRLVIVKNGYPKAGADAIGVSVPHYLERRAGIAAFADAGAYRGGGETIGDTGSPDRVDSMSVTPSFFPTLGVTATLGRTFSAEEGEEGKNDVVVLSDGMWRERFASDPKILGRTLRLGGGRVCTVVGVMPAGFRFLSQRPQLWTPLVFSEDSKKPESRHSNNMNMVARLKPGVSLAEAQSQIDALNTSAMAEDPFAQLVKDAGFKTTVLGLHADYVAEMKPVLLLLQAGVVFLLLIGIVNLANLVLVRTTGRSKEFSLRQVLGAGRQRVARQVVTEMLVLSVLGGAAGLGVGWAALRGLNSIGVDQLPRSADLRVDGLVSLVGITASILVGFLLAVPAVWHGVHGNLAAALSVESRGGTTSRATHRLRHALIVAQFALAFVLLSGAGLLGLSFARVLAVRPGFQPENVLTATVALPRMTYEKEEQRLAFIERLERELATLPGINATGFGSNIPFGDNFSINGITVKGHEPRPGQTLLAHYTAGVTGGYFNALGIPLREGRFLTAEDSARKSRVCVVDEDFVRKYWPTGSALGQQLYNGPPDPKEEPFTIVGVVGSIKQNDLADQQAKGALYLPYLYYPSNDIAIVLRTAQAPALAGPLLRAAVLRIDSDLPLAELKTLTGRIDDSLVSRRSPLLLAAAFAAVALLLAGVGLYGVLAYAVAQRRREIGVRMALGAQPEQIRVQFLRLGVRLVAAGVALGAVGSWLSGRAMGSQLFGVGAMHPGVLASTAAVLAAIALVACLLPALRAAKVPPMEALRGD